MTLLHLGPVHAVERLLTLVLAFGPFVLLAVTVWWSRRRHARAAPPGGPREGQPDGGRDGQPDVGPDGLRDGRRDGHCDGDERHP